jgi:hypothetical protein
MIRNSRSSGCAVVCGMCGVWVGVWAVWCVSWGECEEWGVGCVWCGVSVCMRYGVVCGASYDVWVIVCMWCGSGVCVYVVCCMDCSVFVGCGICGGVAGVCMGCGVFVV